MVLSVDRLQALRGCCRDEVAYAQLCAILGISPAQGAAIAPDIPPEPAPAAPEAPQDLARSLTTATRQSELLRGVAEACSYLLTGEDATESLHLALAALGQATGVDRVYIFQIHPHPETGEMAASQRFEWVTEGIPPIQQSPSVQNRRYTEYGLTDWFDTLARGESLSGLTHQFLPPVQEMLQEQGVLSVLAMPIAIHGQLWGCIGFDDCHTERLWSADETAALQLMAASLGGAIARQQAEFDHYQSETRYRAMLDASPDLMFLLSKDGTYLDCKGNSSTPIPREEIIGRTIVEILPEAIAKLCMDTIRKAAETGELQTCEYQLEIPIGLRDYEARIVVSGNDEVLASVQDVTERKQAEAAIRQSEARNRALVDALPDLIFRIHRDGTYLDCKVERDDDSLLPPRELIGKTVYEVLPPDLAAQRMHYIHKALETGQTQRFEYQLDFAKNQRAGNLYSAIAPSDGAVPSNLANLRDYEARLIVCDDDEVMVIVRDITERKLAEAALRFSEEKFAKAFYSSPNPLTISTIREGRFIEVNDNFLAITGYSKTEVIGQSVFTLNLWDDPAQRQEAIARLQQDGAVINLECRFRMKSGKIRTGLFSAEIITVGSEPCMLGMVVDITDRQRAEQQLWAAAERDRLLRDIALRIRESLDLTQILNTTVAEIRQFLQVDRVYVAHNDADGVGRVVAESVAGCYPPMLGKTFAHPDHLRVIQTIFAEGQVRVVNNIHEEPYFTTLADFYAENQIQAGMVAPILLDHQLFGVLAVNQCSRDRTWEPFEVDLMKQLATQVTIAIQQAHLYQQVQELNTGLEQQVAERTAELQQRMEELQELNQLKDEFLNAFSHDLRTPIMGISLVINNLLNQSGDTLTLNRNILERMLQSSTHQLQLINSLLQAHSSEVRGVILNYELVPLSLLTQVIVEELEPLVAKNQATLFNHVPDDLPLVNADPLQLRRVFENLITNALHHNPPGIHLTLDATVEAEMIRFILRDNGVGIPPEICNSLFDRYARGRNSRHSSGIGLGLYLCRQIITAHGGQIGVDSTVGKGSTFWLTLPLAIASSSTLTSDPDA